MRIPELQPLIEKAALLRDDRKVRDIYEFIWAELQNVQTPSMAQSACEKSY
jgi:hypothetical protein